MSGQDSGDKTEKPSAKKLRDARKKGEVPKSKEITGTLLLMIWLGVAAIGSTMFQERIAGLVLQSFDAIQLPFSNALPMIGWASIEAMLLIMAVALAPVVLVAIAVEYAQAGPVFTFEKVTPKVDNMNPVNGVKKMFSADNLVELLKSVIKTLVMLCVGWMCIKSLLPQFALLLGAEPRLMGQANYVLIIRLLSWTVGVFAFIAVLDVFWQHHSFTKKHMMSMHDLKQEHKESEGDPHIKAHRRRAHQEWSQRNAAKAASGAAALVVNPTHVAVAIDYDAVRCPVPMLIDKGTDDAAMAMRQSAEEAGVPVVRNVELARDILDRVQPGEVLPNDLFQVIAEVIVWSMNTRERLKEFEQYGRVENTGKYDLPGEEDLTRYPDGWTEVDSDE